MLNQGSLPFRHKERQGQVFHHFAKDLLAAADLYERITSLMMG
jgi:hypothetical protein